MINVRSFGCDRLGFIHLAFITISFIYLPIVLSEMISQHLRSSMDILGASNNLNVCTYLKHLIYCYECYIYYSRTEEAEIEMIILISKIDQFEN